MRKRKEPQIRLSLKPDPFNRLSPCRISKMDPENDTMHFQNLFSPITINGMTLKNRIVMSAMHLGYTPGGEVTDRLVEFYRLRALGGAALIIVGGCPIDESGSMRNMIGLNDDRFLPGLERLTRAVQGGGARIAAQLYQAGRYTHSSMIGGRKPFSASPVRSKFTGETPRALEPEEIPVVQDRFAEAALRAQKGGFDAVEILGSAGYLISQFLSPLTNRREDRYGGSFENRMRFGLEVVEKVRRVAGPHYPIIMRLAGNDFMDGGNTNREARIFAGELEKAGVDLFNVTGGWHETRVPQLTSFVPHKAFTYLARGIKSAVSVPVIASNRINDPALGEEVILHGHADLVTMARALLADPELPNKAGEGRTRQIYHCVACNQGCFDSTFSQRPVTCLVNPAAGAEGDLVMTEPRTRKRVLVIGGGPAGMKAACTAARRGHKVTLVEKNHQLGGQLLLNRHVPGREEIATAAGDLANNLFALDVEVLLSQEADIPMIKERKPDAVVLATGALPLVPDIAGIDRPEVTPAWDVLSGNTRAGERVVVIGGNAVGLETALYLAGQGSISPETLYFLAANRAEPWDTLEVLINQSNKKITVVEMMNKAGRDLGDSTRWTVMAELRRFKVKVLNGARAVEINEMGVTIEKKGQEHLLEADTVVIAAGSMPKNSLWREIKALVPECYLIGDAKEPRNALQAIREGFMIGMKL